VDARGLQQARRWRGAPPCAGHDCGSRSADGRAEGGRCKARWVVARRLPGRIPKSRRPPCGTRILHEAATSSLPPSFTPPTTQEEEAGELRSTTVASVSVSSDGVVRHRRGPAHADEAGDPSLVHLSDPWRSEVPPRTGARRTSSRALIRRWGERGGGGPPPPPPVRGDDGGGGSPAARRGRGAAAAVPD
jgi:hypothetical protein